MNFYNISYLLWLWALPFVVFILFYAHIKVNKKLDLFAKARVFELIGQERSSLKVFLRGFLISLSFLCMIFALARPRWGYDWKELPRGGVDIMLVLDLSSSMLATDISPNRLERAKREVTDLIEMLEGDRIGIVPFAGVSYVSCPLTSDYRLAALFLNQLSMEAMTIQGTNIYGAVKRAAESLEKASGAGSQGKAIILMTDGEDGGESSLQSLIDFLKPKGVKVFSIGIGGVNGAPIPEKGGGFKKDSTGKVVLSKLDESYLKELSLATGGSYIRSTSGDMDLDFIYRNGIKENIEAGSHEVKKQKIWHERFQWFVFLALVFFLLQFFIRDYRKIDSKEVV